MFPLLLHKLDMGDYQLFSVWKGFFLLGGYHFQLSIKFLTIPGTFNPQISFQPIIAEVCIEDSSLIFFLMVCTFHMVATSNRVNPNIGMAPYQFFLYSHSTDWYTANHFSLIFLENLIYDIFLWTCLKKGWFGGWGLGILLEQEGIKWR